MRPIQAKVFNFQSYEALDIDFRQRGLTLVSGPTGAGKSTLLDVLPWILYGVTSKQGGVDDVRRWGADADTMGVAEVETSSGLIRVVRTRGARNDLWWEEGDSDAHRGKNLNDTQALIEARLGVTAEQFLSGSYLTQFSRADHFFTSPAKDRRALLERVADLQFPTALSDKASEARREAKKAKGDADQVLSRARGRLDVLSEQLPRLRASYAQWDLDRQSLLNELSSKFNNYDRDRKAKLAKLAAAANGFNEDKDAQLATLVDELEAVNATLVPDETFKAQLKDLADKMKGLGSAKCPTCQAPTSSRERFDITAAQAKVTECRVLNTAAATRYDSLKEKLQRLSSQVNPYEAETAILEAQQNPYGPQVEAAKAQMNPHTAQLEQSGAQLADAKKGVKAAEVAVGTQEERIADLTWIYDRSFQMRALMMERAVRQVEKGTNEILERHFDAALRVKFILDGSDKLDVSCTNNGYPAPFGQLSGGERAMLKLAFCLSMMTAVQNHSGQKFTVLMLDEALNGLDESLKVRAFALLETLEQRYETVYAVEHSEAFKQLFTTRIVVEKVGSRSTMVVDGEPAHNAKGAGLNKGLTTPGVQSERPKTGRTRAKSNRAPGPAAT